MPAVPVVAEDRSGGRLIRVWIPLPVAIAVGLVALVAGAVLVSQNVPGYAFVLAFFLFAPGFALVRLIGLRDLQLEVILSVALSLALAGIVATSQAYLGVWSPAATVAMLVAVTAVALLARPLMVMAPRLLPRLTSWVGSIGSLARPVGRAAGQAAAGAAAPIRAAAASRLPEVAARVGELPGTVRSAGSTTRTGALAAAQAIRDRAQRPVGGGSPAFERARRSLEASLSGVNVERRAVDMAPRAVDLLPPVGDEPAGVPSTPVRTRPARPVRPARRVVEVTPHAVVSTGPETAPSGLGSVPGKSRRARKPAEPVAEPATAVRPGRKNASTTARTTGSTGAGTKAGRATKAAAIAPPEKRRAGVEEAPLTGKVSARVPARATPSRADRKSVPVAAPGPGKKAPHRPITTPRPSDEPASVAAPAVAKKTPRPKETPAPPAPAAPVEKKAVRATPLTSASAAIAGGGKKITRAREQPAPSAPAAPAEKKSPRSAPRTRSAVDARALPANEPPAAPTQPAAPTRPAAPGRPKTSRPRSAAATSRVDETPAPAVDSPVERPPAPIPPARRERSGSSAGSDELPPPPVAVIHRRPKAPDVPGETRPRKRGALGGDSRAETGASRTFRSAVEHVVDDLADQRDRKPE